MDKHILKPPIPGQLEDKVRVSQGPECDGLTLWPSPKDPDCRFSRSELLARLSFSWWRVGKGGCWE